MNLLFVHDHIFYEDKEGNYYSVGGFPWYLWKKYFDHFEKITVIGRYGGNLGKENVVKSSTDNVIYDFVPKISSIKGLLKDLKHVKFKIFEKVKYSDAVIARLPSENGLIAINYALKLNKPLAIEVVGCAWDALWNYGGMLSKLYAPVLFFRMKRAIKKSNKLLYVTDKILQKRYPAKKNAQIVSASNVDIAPLNEQIIEKRINSLKDDMLKSKKIVFGLIGNFKTKYKGIHVAIKALAKIKKEYSGLEFELKVLGKGNPKYYEDLALQLGLNDNLEFCGTLPNGRPVLEWLDNINIYLQPSFQEGKPRTLIEAMSRGCICLGSNVGGIPELLDDKFIHKKGNYKQLAKQIKNILEKEKEELELIARNNFELAKQYTSDILEEKRYNFYKLLKEEAIKS